jgi:hypothetical protein
MKEIITIDFSGNRYVTGDTVVFSLRGSTFNKGKIYVENNKEFFICHNIRELEGNVSPNRLGYKYSWVIELNDENISLEPGDALFMMHDAKDMETFRIITYPKLTHFIQHSFSNYPLFNIKLGVLDSYDRITEAKEQGYVELHSKDRGKKLTIKLGRLLRKLIIKYNIVIKDSKNNPIQLNDELIEKLHNKWISYNLGVDFEIVRGEDILKGYTSKYYAKDKKINSCMTDKFEFLKLYTSNPKQIELMIFYLNHEICGRSLIWTCDDGNKYHDRVYYSHDWIKPAIDNTLANNNLKPVPPNRNVTLDKPTHKYYPYIDTFFYGSSNENIVSNYRREKTNRQYRNAGGVYAPIN